MGRAYQVRASSLTWAISILRKTAIWFDQPASWTFSSTWKATSSQAGQLISPNFKHKQYIMLKLYNILNKGYY